MAKKKIAKSIQEFDHRFDNGEDIHDIIDMSKAKVIRHGKKVRKKNMGRKLSGRKLKNYIRRMKIRSSLKKIKRNR